MTACKWLKELLTGGCVFLILNTPKNWNIFVYNILYIIYSILNLKSISILYE